MKVYICFDENRKIIKICSSHESLLNFISCSNKFKQEVEILQERYIEATRKLYEESKSDIYDIKPVDIDPLAEYDIALKALVKQYNINFSGEISIEEAEIWDSF